MRKLTSIGKDYILLLGAEIAAILLSVATFNAVSPAEYGIDTDFFVSRNGWVAAFGALRILFLLNVFGGLLLLLVIPIFVDTSRVVAWACTISFVIIEVLLLLKFRAESISLSQVAAFAVGLVPIYGYLVKVMASSSSLTRRQI